MAHEMQMQTITRSKSECRANLSRNDQATLLTKYECGIHG